ncbi:hypothetical protein V1477_019780 [Vespula maculifrons]|uniref:Uncharacterized protein n=1 Tax=Vespula maculifrons TaxID=7453 RepID=A0ABD2ARE9_VESMC
MHLTFQDMILSLKVFQFVLQLYTHCKSLPKIIPKSLTSLKYYHMILYLRYCMLLLCNMFLGQKILKSENSGYGSI